jgi:lipopolysaccharide/colanic/teichoic acid biosynthesis glycosyltransferase
MAVIPVVIDSRPAYIGEGSGLSLLQLPYGGQTLLTHVMARLETLTPYQPTIIRNFDADASEYAQALSSSGCTRVSIVDASGFRARIAASEPSDWLLIVDPICFPVNGCSPATRPGDVGELPRFVYHMIALDANVAGTNERVEFDMGGRVRRVQRYYDSVTWTVCKGVTASWLPVSSLTMSHNLPFGSLVDLRRALVDHGVPSKDLQADGIVFDLASEQGFLALNEHRLRRCIGLDDATLRARSVTVHPSARIVGPVVMHPGAEIHEGVRVIGPTVVGAGARLERGAVVAHSVVGRSVRVPAHAVIRQRFVATSAPVRSAPIPPLEPLEMPPVAIVQEPKVPFTYPAVKRVLETLIAGFALAVLSPLLALIAVLVKLESRGPVFYRDPREAKDGRLFHCFKFRTMIANAHAAQRDLASHNQVDGPQFKIPRDPRVTRIGRWLRPTNIDELPQLFNVVLGQMSLVGPRPSPFRENQTCVPWREARLSVRPGITGLWQICRHNREQGDFHQWIYYDMHYVRHMSFLVDLKILAGTVVVIFGGRSHIPLAWIIPDAPQGAAERTAPRPSLTA